MKARTLIVYVAACFLCMAGSALAQKAAGGGGKPVPCTNPSLAVTIVPIDGSTITGDGKGATYTNGQYGVVNTVINLCQSGGTSPNYDATLGLSGSQRSMGFTCPSAIAGSIIDGPSPVWANGAMFQTQPWIQIHNILHGRMHGLSTFTTRMIVGYVKGPGDSKYYDLRIQNDNVDAVQTELVLNTNSPSETATVTVQDVRGTCHDYPQTGTKDSWGVTVDQPFIGTLITMDKNKTHAGQYHMPMQFGIDVLACPRCGPSTLLRAIPSHVEGWRALPADRADRRGLGDRAHSAPSAPAHRGPNAASGAGAAAARGLLVQPGHGRCCIQLIPVIGVRRCRVAGGPPDWRADDGRTSRTRCN